AARLAGTEVALAAAGHPVRTAFARNLLPRRVPRLRRAFRHGRDQRRHSDADRQQHHRNPDHVRDGRPDRVVQTHRRRTATQAAARCRPCRRRGMKTWVAKNWIAHLRASALCATMLCTAIAWAEPTSDYCAVPNYL